MGNPDYVYDPDNWECTYDWGDRGLLVEDDRRVSRVGDVQRFETLVKGPPKFAAVVATEIQDGEVMDWETQWFDTEAEAKAAASKR